MGFRNIQEKLENICTFRDLATLIKVGINLPFKMLGNNLLQWDIIIKRTSHNVTSWGLEKHQIWMTFHDSSLAAFSQILFNIRFCKNLYIYVSVTSLLEDCTEESGFKKHFGSDQNLSQIKILSYFKHNKTLEKLLKRSNL